MKPVPPLAVRGHNLAGFGAETPLPLAKLFAGERRLYDRIRDPRRRAEWLIGRAALKAAAAAVNLSTDTSRLQLPHPRLSLTHCAGASIAVCADPSGPAAVLGIGVDYEQDHSVNHEVLRLFASDEELAGLDLGADTTILQLWTIKEAAFKACRENGNLVLNDVVIRHLSSSGCGEAWLRSRDDRIFFSSYRHSSGWLSVALSLEI
jgi:4'-phosphopantetheinyl transferase EntD